MLRYANAGLSENRFAILGRWIACNLDTILFRGLLLVSGTVVGAMIGALAVQLFSAPAGPPVWEDYMELRAGPFVRGDQHPPASAEIMALAAKHHEQLTSPAWMESSVSILKLNWPDGRPSPNINELQSRVHVSAINSDGSFSVAATGSDAEECKAIEDAVCQRYIDSLWFTRDLYVIGGQRPAIRPPDRTAESFSSGAGAIVGFVAMCVFVRRLPCRTWYVEPASPSVAAPRDVVNSTRD